MAKTIDSLRAELAEAKAKLEAEGKFRLEDQQFICKLSEERRVERNLFTSQLLSLQSHNAKLMEALKTIGDSANSTGLITLYKYCGDALASQPDNELRDRVREVLQFYASAWVRSTFNGIQKFNHPDDELTNDGGHRAAELLSSL